MTIKIALNLQINFGEVDTVRECLFCQWVCHHFNGLYFGLVWIPTDPLYLRELPTTLCILTPPPSRYRIPAGREECELLIWANPGEWTAHPPLRWLCPRACLAPFWPEVKFYGAETILCFRVFNGNIPF
jgi:hypothetical protein